MNEPLLQQNRSGDADPNIPQRAASNPQDSIWVAASAGSGKTKVLTDRVLRLLLPRTDGRDGTEPRRILCLTYTKAAANEMSQRIHKILASWAVMDLDNADDKKSLRKQLSNLMGAKPTQDQIGAAQQLFAKVVDCPSGLQIMTIHSFCKSVLSRFPVEADLPPNFDLIQDAEVFDLMKRAQVYVLNQALESENAASPIADAVQNLTEQLDEDSFSALMQIMCQERHQLLKLLDQYGDVERLFVAVCNHFNIAQGLTSEQVMAAFCDDVHFLEKDLREIASLMMQDKGKTSQGHGAGLLQWLNVPAADRLRQFSLCKSAFLVDAGTIKKQSFPSAAIRKSHPHLAETLLQEGQRLVEALEMINKINCAIITRDILMIGFDVVKRYTILKQARGVLDYDDLILKTIALLTGNTEKFSMLKPDDRSMAAPWIMYKLDQGLDHILVDEAQDTNPEQWSIIKTLWDEFFSGQGAREDVLRTSFVVGDVKQSIYSFQRAAPKAFQKMQGVVKEKVMQSERNFASVGMDISFRTARSVLDVVDRVFETPFLHNAVGGEAVRHSSFRKGQAGRVELWPVFETPKAEKRAYWTPPIEIVEKQTGSAQLATFITGQIQTWLRSKEILPSHNRPIHAGDIMILVRSRSAFVEQLVRALKSEGVPVSGVDRMVLGEQIVVQDMIAMAKFCLMPTDDLTLATLLKSPLFGWDDDELFSLSYKRKGTLWAELCDFTTDRLPIEKTRIVDEKKRQSARQYLARLSSRIDYMGAYEFFTHILNAPCPANAQSGLRAVRMRLGDDALDPLDEFLNTALEFSHDNTDHLQLFVQHHESQSSEIKRELEEGGRKVRIMTIHASKGLQAPIVILPDTIKSSSRRGGRLLLPNKTNLDVPLFSARKAEDPPEYKEAYERCESLEDEEYYRLLYVAMTRAEDRLYIAGHKRSGNIKEESWYCHIQNAMEAHPDCQKMGDDLLRVENPQEAEPDREREIKAQVKQDMDLPPWARALPTAEPTPPRPLVPSRPSLDEDDTHALSPLLSTEGSRFRRGNVTHKLLQFLPDFEEGLRKNAALRFVHKNAADLSECVRESIVAEVMGILSHPDYGAFFKPGSMAEVSVTGLMDDNRIVSGEIDRLVIEGNEIWIVDYKTNRPPPDDPKDVPRIYFNQLRAYRDSIAKIYPDYVIHCALLWTDGPNLMVLDV